MTELNDPMTINLFVTETCNFECGHCMFSCSPKTKAEYMQFDVYSRVAQWVRDLDYNAVVNLVGGEPTLNPRHLDQMVDFFFRNDINMEMTTNGWWLRSVKHLKRVAPIICKIIDSGSYVRISDSPYHMPFRKGEQYFFNGDLFELENQCLARCCNNCASELNDEQYCSCCKEYCEDWEYEVNDENGLYWLHQIQDKFADGTLYADKQAKTPASISATGRAASFGYQRPSCYDSNEIVTILPDGRIRDLCCNGGHYPMGTVFDTEIDDIITERREFILTLKEYQIDCASCKHFCEKKFNSAPKSSCVPCEV